MTRPSTQQVIHVPDPSDECADRILAAALQVFGEHGFAGSRLCDIARRAGVSMSTLRLHFPSKEEVFREVVRSSLMVAVNSVKVDANPANGSAAEAVRAIARGYWRTMGQPEVIAAARLVLSEVQRFPELAMLLVTEALERSVRVLEGVIEAGVARRELRPVNARAQARIIQAALVAHAFWFAHPEIYAGLTGGDRERAEGATIDALIRSLVPAEP